jgi:hypothetical protein
VVVVGSLRGGERAWRSLLDRVVAPSGADLALMLARPPPLAGRSAIDAGTGAAAAVPSLRRAAKFTWHVPEAADWGAAIDEAHPARVELALS